jgi:hypothetical protein
VLSEKLILGNAGDFELDDRMLNYLSVTLDPIDKPNINLIYNEIKERIKEVTTDYIYQSLLYGTDFYIKYEYWIDNNFSIISLYSDPEEMTWKESTLIGVKNAD